MEPFTHSVVDEKKMLTMETLEILAVLYGGLHGRSSALSPTIPHLPKASLRSFSTLTPCQLHVQHPLSNVPGVSPQHRSKPSPPELSLMICSFLVLSILDSRSEELNIFISALCLFVTVSKPSVIIKWWPADQI